jgi:hypothetical protein
MHGTLLNNVYLLMFCCCCCHAHVQGQLPSARSRHTPAAQQCHDWAAYGLPTRLTTQVQQLLQDAGCRPAVQY